MGAVIPTKILGLEGQVIKKVLFDEESGRVRVVCDRDRRRRPVDHRTGRTGSVNRLLRRTVLDVPLGGWPCEIEIEYAETFLSFGQVRVERLPFVSPGVRVTRRYARLIAGMARHMPISTVARHTGLSWDSVKAIECAHLAETIPIPDPKSLEGTRTLGDLTGHQAIKGSLWLLLSNRTTLKDTDQDRLDQLLAQNQPLATLYALKEQLQRLWQPDSTFAAMTARLDDWCGMAIAAGMAGLAKFVKTLQAHRTGICAYADHPITTSRLEAGNVSIALLRRRARGFRDMTYFNLKIFQLNTRDTPSFLYNRVSTAPSLIHLSTVGKP